MKKRYVIIPIIVVVIVVFIIIVCTSLVAPYKGDIKPDEIKVYKESHEYMYDESEENDAEQLCTVAAEYENNIYYINPNTKNLCMIDMGFEKEKVFIEDNIEGFLFVDQKLYYATDEKFSVIDMNENEEIVIDGVYPNKITMTKNHIFFCDKNDRLFRVNIDGTNVQKLSSAKINHFFIRGDIIFYTKLINKIFERYNMIYAMNDDGTNERLLIDLDIDRWLEIVCNNIYISRHLSNSIYKFDLSNAKITKVNKIEYEYMFAINKDRLYYGTYEQSYVDSRLVSCDLNGENTRQIDDGGCYHPEIADEHVVIYYNQTDEIRFYNMEDEEVIIAYAASFDGDIIPVILDDMVCLRFGEYIPDPDNEDESIRKERLRFYDFHGKLLYSID